MIVLDTHIWHWWINQIPGKLSPDIIDLIEETEAVAISAISCFDRIIIATALHHHASLLSFDAAFPAYHELDGYLIQAK
ncbi:hypothetical protein [Candidatus Methylomicrobium oryzae]|uniref:hypothetical protein n=1 Tax=Candidatus Methylomicrobium oryzae TaxID=2802053 RepID=UPI00192120FC|nr:hypothetical protein [Methylomicrobium sp. RS1]MBL1265410.1 hypothetical protein [Methylomicrobium sp. RS1]